MSRRVLLKPFAPWSSVFFRNVQLRLFGLLASNQRILLLGWLLLVNQWLLDACVVVSAEAEPRLPTDKPKVLGIPAVRAGTCTCLKSQDRQLRCESAIVPRTACLISQANPIVPHSTHGLSPVNELSIVSSRRNLQMVYRLIFGTSKSQRLSPKNFISSLPPNKTIKRTSKTDPPKPTLKRPSSALVFCPSSAPLAPRPRRPCSPSSFSRPLLPDLRARRILATQRHSNGKRWKCLRSFFMSKWGFGFGFQTCSHLEICFFLVDQSEKVFLKRCLLLEARSN